MSEIKKIKKEQLELLQTLVKQIQNGQMQIGQIETQKHLLLHQVADVQKTLKDTQDKLEEEYGKVSISIVDGTITKQELNELATGKNKEDRTVKTEFEGGGEIFNEKPDLEGIKELEGEGEIGKAYEFEEAKK